MKTFLLIQLLPLLLAPSPASAFAQPSGRCNPTSCTKRCPSTTIGTKVYPYHASRRIRQIHGFRGGGLFSASAPRTTGDAGAEVEENPVIDYVAVCKWVTSLTVQTAAAMGVLAMIDSLLARFSLKVPFYANVAFFYFFNLTTSAFSLLPNRGKEQQKLEQADWEYNKRRRPGWTPPAFVFVLMWPLFVFGLRAVTAAMVVQASGIYATPAIGTLMLHLGFGNLWNSVNNIEGRLGPSTIILYGLVLSKVLASFAFYRVVPLAGKLLSLTLTWLTAAAALETNTWAINPDPDTGKLEPFYPVKAKKWRTRFRWEP